MDVISVQSSGSIPAGGVAASVLRRSGASLAPHPRWQTISHNVHSADDTFTMRFGNQAKQSNDDSLKAAAHDHTHHRAPLAHIFNILSGKA